MEESEAIAQLKRGDINGLETLVYAYQVQAVRTAYLITHDRTLAEDIVQAAFLRAYERIAQFDATRPFGPWFLRSVVYDAIKVVTQRQRQVSLERTTDRGPYPWWICSVPQALAMMIAWNKPKCARPSKRRYANCRRSNVR